MASEVEEQTFDPGAGAESPQRRDHELDPELGAAPFDPGPEVGFDDRRAKRAERRREKAERKQREREDRERAEREQREREEAERRDRARTDAERAERESAERADAAKREQRARIEAEHERQRMEERRALQAQADAAAEQRESRRRERERAEAEQRDRKRRARETTEEKQRQEQLQRQRERRLREERVRPQRKEAQGKKAAQARRDAVATKAVDAGEAPPQRPVSTKPAPRPATPAHPHRVSLRRPTAKAALALLAVAAFAFGAGALLGLPLPLVGDDSEPNADASPAAAASLAGIDPGTPVGLTKGPYFPVVLDRPADYGDKLAKFGAPRSGHTHEGQDVIAKPGTPLVAVRDGIVVDGAGGESFYSYGGGNDVVIYSPIDDRSYVYLHMLRPALVKAGDTVKAGQLVGQVGCSGACDGPHLHFESRLGRAVYGPQKKAINPLPELKRWPQRPAN